MNLKNLIKRVDFGDIDGLYDPKLTNYYLNFDYKEKIYYDNIYFVIGRKGTGKSALYNYIHRTQGKEGNLVSNLSFNTFPFEKLLMLEDNSFSRPNQYQSIWRNIILTEYAKLIVTGENNEQDDIFNELKRHVKFIFGEDLLDLHKQVTRAAYKNDKGIGIKRILNVDFKSTESQEKEYVENYDNITKINERLEYLIRSYLKMNENNTYLIQFDQLDDNYNTYTNSDLYFQCLISLFKTVYDINQTFRRESIKTKTVIYLRSDIFYSINSYDSESARWEQFKHNLSWVIVNRTDWHNPKLKQVLDKRISSSVAGLKSERPFDTVFNNRRIGLEDKGNFTNVFKYMVHRSFHRPRDIIQFCKYTQIKVKETDDFSYRTIKDAEKEYSLWLLGELANEITPKIKNTDSLYEMLRLFGQGTYTLSDFKTKFKNFEGDFNIDAEGMLKFLYSLGIILNVNPKKQYTEFYSIIRNDRSVFNRDLKIQTHPGFYLGLHTSKYMKR